jgi:hypothetical protein
LRTALRALPYLILAIAMFPATALAGTPVAGQARVALDSASHTADFSTTASRRSVVILNEWERDKMQALKRANPGITVLMYKNLSFMQDRGASGNAATGVTWADAKDHPEWFLLNTAGQQIVPWSFTWNRAADIGNRGYQQKWADNVISLLTGGWDGVFMDDTNPTMKYHYDPAQVAKYPNDAAYSAATGSALAYIGPRIRAAGKLAIPNLGSWSAYRSTVDSWLPYVSGGMEEQFGKWGNDPATGYVTGNQWQRQLDALKLSQSQGKLFIAITHSQPTDAKAARYGWASVLLGAGGKAAYSLAADYTNETWFPEYGYDLGDATGAETTESGGVHRREFQRGLVLVNPTTAAVAVRFGGTYSGSGLTAATGATLAPASALVLTRDGAAPSTPTAPPSTGGTYESGPSSPNVEVGEGTMADLPAAPAGDDVADADPVADGSTVARGPRGMRVKIRCRSHAGSCRTRVTVRLRGTRVGKRTVKVRAGRAKTVSVRLNRRGRAALASRPKSLRVVISRAR